MKTEHTQGTWDIRGANGLKVIFGKGGDICEMCSRSNYPHAQREADARLITRAPELFEALQELVRGLELHIKDKAKLPYAMPVSVFDTARAAIARATESGVGK